MLSAEDSNRLCNSRQKGWGEKKTKIKSRVMVLREQPLCMAPDPQDNPSCNRASSFTPKVVYEHVIVLPCHQLEILHPLDNILYKNNHALKLWRSEVLRGKLTWWMCHNISLFHSSESVIEVTLWSSDIQTQFPYPCQTKLVWPSQGENPKIHNYVSERFKLLN